MTTIRMTTGMEPNRNIEEEDHVVTPITTKEREQVIPQFNDVDQISDNDDDGKYTNDDIYLLVEVCRS